MERAKFVLIFVVNVIILVQVIAIRENALRDMLFTLVQLTVVLVLVLVLPVVLVILIPALLVLMVSIYLVLNV